MIKKLNNGNNLIISHIADIDGMGGVILSLLIDPEIDYILCEPNEIVDALNSINNNYKTIYISDLSLSNEETYKYIDDNFKNVIHFDHHLYSSDINYDWSHVFVNYDDIPASGTSLIYNYFKENYSNNKYICNKYTNDFVEAIRSYDTWDFKRTGNLTGKKLTEIFSIIGIEDFIDRFYKRLKDNYDKIEFSFTDEEIKMIEKKEKEVSEYVDLCDESLIYTTFLGYKVGVSISEDYRSEVGNVLSSRHKDLDFILIANFVRGSFSFRTTNDINLNEVAKKIGGGGHEKAAGARMTDENKKIFFECLLKKDD